MAKKKTASQPAARLLALAAELNLDRAKVPVTGSRTYLFCGEKVYLLYTDCPTEQTARTAENFTQAELAWLAEDFQQNGLEQKARALKGGLL